MGVCSTLLIPISSEGDQPPRRSFPRAALSSLAGMPSIVEIYRSVQYLPCVVHLDPSPRLLPEAPGINPTPAYLPESTRRVHIALHQNLDTIVSVKVFLKYR